MTKADIVREIVDECGIEKNVAVKAVETVMNSIKSSIANGQNVYLRGFGTFHIVVQKAKKARVITKGITIELPERNRVKFKPSKEFRNVVPSKDQEL